MSLYLCHEWDKTDDAIRVIRQFEPNDGYYVAFSGGKDSIVVKHLVKQAGVKYELHYHVTNVDPPELIYYMRRHHPDVIYDRPKTSMWGLIVYNKMPPTRLARYCCEGLKECHGRGRVLLTGVRRKESFKRRKRQVVETCINDPSKTYVNPIIDWSDYDVWSYIHNHRLPYCGLYNQGRKRIGCVLCPMGGIKQKKDDICRWPKIYNAYLKTFAKIVPDKQGNWETPEDVMNWWIYGKHEDGMQLNMFD